MKLLRNLLKIDQELTEGARNGRDVLKVLEPLHLIEEAKTTRWAVKTVRMGEKVIGRILAGSILIKSRSRHDQNWFYAMIPGRSYEKDGQPWMFEDREVEKLIADKIIKVLD